jgi:hypothetical protein
VAAKRRKKGAKMGSESEVFVLRLLCFFAARSARLCGARRSVPTGGGLRLGRRRGGCDGREMRREDFERV